MDKIIVSVLLPMFNASSFIEEAVYSILEQTFTFFELIIIDDCSTDNSLQIVENIKDSRIILIKKKQNTGYTDSLNWALKLSRGKYVARMDADDISLPNRFKTQVTFLNENPEVILCGSWFEIIGSSEVIKHPTYHGEISIALLDYCAIGHPTVMFRRDEFIKHGLWYDIEMEPAEDHNLWVKAIRIGKLQNIPKVLLRYRLHQSQISIKQKVKQDEYSCTAKRFHLDLLYKSSKPLIDITAPIIFKNIDFRIQKKYINQYLNELEYLNMLNKSLHIFNIKGFEVFCLQKRTFLIKQWFEKAQSEYLMHLAAFINPSTGYYRYFKNSRKINLVVRYLNPRKW